MTNPSHDPGRDNSTLVRVNSVLDRQYKFTYGVSTRMAAPGTAESGSLPPGLDKFPLPRPKGWPAIMAWPNAEIVQEWSTLSATYTKAVMGTGEARDQARQAMREFIRNYAIAAEVMREREAVVKDRLAIADARIDRRVMNLQLGRYFRRDTDKPMSWACLLRVEVSSDARIQNVAAFTNTAARTTDGGIVLADDKGLIVTKPSPQAIELLVVESAARGWPEVRISGNKELCDMALKICRQHNVDAVIQERWNGIPMRQHRVMRSLESHNAILAAAHKVGREQGYDTSAPSGGAGSGGVRNVTPLSALLTRGPLADTGRPPLRQILIGAGPASPAAETPAAQDAAPAAPAEPASFLSGARGALAVDRTARAPLEGPDDDLGPIEDARIG